MGHSFHIVDVPAAKTPKDLLGIKDDSHSLPSELRITGDEALSNA